MARRFATALALSLLALTLLATAAGARSLRSLIAPVSACSNQNDVGFSVAEQERAMRCMTNFARAKVGLAVARRRRRARPLGRREGERHRALRQLQPRGLRPRLHLLDAAASAISRARCWRAGENLAWGTGRAR